MGAERSRVHIHDDILLVGDKGFQGICGVHGVSSFKKPRNGELIVEQKGFNRSLSRFWILIEHVNRRIKRFKNVSIQQISQ